LGDAAMAVRKMLVKKKMRKTALPVHAVVESRLPQTTTQYQPYFETDAEVSP
jgi:hypothetical protein